MGLSYKDAGVDIDKGNKAVEEIKDLVKSTYNPNVITDLGGFGGLFNLQVEKYNNPVLAAATDGVGTKLKLAFLDDKHDTIGIDLVAMSVNDLITLGAKPLFFLDYLATSKLDVKQFKDVVSGIVTGCKKSNCALLGGETAEMPDFYNTKEYDMAGFCVGIVDKDNIITGESIKAGDILIGLASNGIHSNGYSLIRKIFLDGVNTVKQSLLEEFLTPTRIYAKPVLSLVDEFKIKGIAHITGGGIIENIPRMIPDNLTANIDLKSFKTPMIFKKIQDVGKVKKREMYKTFNMGIGMVLAVNPEIKDEVLTNLEKIGEKAYEIGNITKGDEKIILKG